MMRFALPIIVALAAMSPALAQNGAGQNGGGQDGGGQTADPARPSVIVTVTCDDLTTAARSVRPECGPTQTVQRPAAKRQVVPLFRPFQLADRSDRPMRRKILRLPWVIGVYQ